IRDPIMLLKTGLITSATSAGNSTRDKPGGVGRSYCYARMFAPFTVKLMATTKKPPVAEPTVSHAAPSAMLARIESLLPTMGPASHRIGEFVSRHPDQVVHMSVSEVA